MKVKKQILVCISLFIFLALPSIIWAANFNISCCDANDIKTALTTAQSNEDNDTITIAPGTYKLTFPSDPSVVLTYTASSDPVENYSLTINNAGGGQVILDGGNTVQILSITAFAAGAAAHVTIDGITFYDGDIDKEAFSGGGLFVRAGGNITINACVFSNNTATGFFDDPNAGGAFLRAAGTLTLTNSTFRDNVADILGGGVYIFGESGESVIVTNNTFSGNTSNSSTIGGGGIYMKVWGTADIYNNIIWGNTASGGNGEDIYLAKSTSTVNLYNNDFSDLDYDDEVNLTQVNNINQDPLLTTDSNIQEGSPSIDAGSNSAPSLPALDFEGDNRIIGSAPDIGADEYLPPIPTLSEKAMIILIVFMGFIAVYHLKGKRAL